jgi:hypothetical protein
MSVRQLTGLVFLVGCLALPLGAGAKAPAVSCSSVFIQSLQEYRTVCSNGAYYATRQRPALRDWEMQQKFPSGPRKPPPLYRQPQPNIHLR